MWEYNVFALSRDYAVDMSRDFVSGVGSTKVTNRLIKGSIDFVKVDI